MTAAVVIMTGLPLHDTGHHRAAGRPCIHHGMG